MSKLFYFTYGAEGHPFRGGWSEVIAPNEDMARRAFMAVHPSDGNIMCCSSVYSEDEFNGSPMSVKGNLGRKSWEHITLLIEKGEERHG